MVWYDAMQYMTGEEILGFLQPNETVDHKGIFVAKGIAEKTVWDKLSLENPTQAVISAPNEAAAKEKSREQIEDIKRYLTANDILLDFGCGYGRVAKYLLPEMALKGYVGVDSSFEMLTLFKEHYIRSDKEQQTPLLLINADIHTVPLRDNSIDVAIVSAVFHHNHKDVATKAMAELKRVVKPGGTVLIYSSFPCLVTAMGVQGTIYQMFLNLMGKPFKNGPVRYYSKREVLKLFSDFDEVNIIPYGFGIIPKTLIFLPKPIEKLYRRGFSNPVNRLLEKICPESWKANFGSYYDVIAKR
jgi:ubiquinone/menaquinone biosynthesis C-methylase UbiE